MIIIGRTRQAVTQALRDRGFLLVADLPAGTRFEFRRGMHVVVMP
jgi:hypothetical protein